MRIGEPNILTDRLKRLEDRGLLKRERSPIDGRKWIYIMTEAGISLIPVLLEIIIWSAQNDMETTVSDGFVQSAMNDREAMIDRLTTTAREAAEK